jgi:hypothetical protein
LLFFIAQPLAFPKGVCNVLKSLTLSGNLYPKAIKGTSGFNIILEEFEDTKGVIRIRKSKKDRQHNGQKTEEQTTQWPKEKDKTTSNDL